MRHVFVFGSLTLSTKVYCKKIPDNNLLTGISMLYELNLVQHKPNWNGELHRNRFTALLTWLIA